MRIRVLLVAWGTFTAGLAISGAAVEPPTILISRLGPVETQICVSRTDGTDEHVVLNSSGLDYNPAWSPDGQWLVFTSERAGSADLYRVKPDGSGLERLTDHPAYDDQAAFSPDGKRLVFVTTRTDGTAGLWLLDLATKKASPLTSGPGGDFRPAWSPDGRWIAFSSDRGNGMLAAKGRWEQLQQADIYLIQSDGSGLKRLSTHGDFHGGPRWSADSQKIICYAMTAQETWDFRARPARPGFPVAGPSVAGDTRIVSIDVATGAETTLPAGPGIKVAPALLPNGGFGYVRKDVKVKGIFYDADRSGPAGPINSASWSPDGKWVAFHRILSSDTPDWQRTFSPDPRFNLVMTHWLPAFDPTGRSFVATRAVTGELFLNNLETRQQRTLLKRDGQMVMAAQWSAKGDALILGYGSFFQGRSEGAQVAVIAADGTGFRPVTSGKNNNGFPSFAPDGRHFVYRTVGPDGRGLRTKDIDADAVVTLTTEYDNFPVWSPRGDRIAFMRLQDGDFEIFTIRPDGTDLRRLTNSPGNDGHMAWSPDGDWLLFTSGRKGFKDEVLYTDSPQPYGDIFVMRHDGTQVQQLTDNQWEEGTPAWRPSPGR
jgi:Tol biopolymer transport system component